LNRGNLAAQKDLHYESSSTGHKAKRVNPFCVHLTEILGKFEMFHFQKKDWNRNILILPKNFRKLKTEISGKIKIFQFQKKDWN
jgi:hypothetical protein